MAAAAAANNDNNAAYMPEFLENTLQIEHELGCKAIVIDCNSTALQQHHHRLVVVPNVQTKFQYTAFLMYNLQINYQNKAVIFTGQSGQMVEDDINTWKTNRPSILKNVNFGSIGGQISVGSAGAAVEKLRDFRLGTISALIFDDLAIKSFRRKCMEDEHMHDVRLFVNLDLPSHPEILWKWCDRMEIARKAYIINPHGRSTELIITTLILKEELEELETFYGTTCLNQEQSPWNCGIHNPKIAALRRDYGMK